MKYAIVFFGICSGNIFFALATGNFSPTLRDCFLQGTAILACYLATKIEKAMI